MVIPKSVILMAAPEGFSAEYLPLGHLRSLGRGRFPQPTRSPQVFPLARSTPEPAPRHAWPKNSRSIPDSPLELDPYVRSARRKREETRLVSSERNARHGPSRLVRKATGTLTSRRPICSGSRLSITCPLYLPKNLILILNLRTRVLISEHRNRSTVLPCIRIQKVDNWSHFGKV